MSFASLCHYLQFFFCLVISVWACPLLYVIFGLPVFYCLLPHFSLWCYQSFVLLHCLTTRPANTILCCAVCSNRICMKLVFIIVHLNFCFLAALIDYCVLICCAVQVIQAREIYNEQLPFIAKVLSAAIVGVLD